MPQRTVLIALSFIAFTSLGLPDGLLGVSWPSIRQDFDVPLDNLGLVIAIATAGYLCASFCSGMVLRILPLGTVLALSTFAASFALLGFAFAPYWWVILILSFIAGLGGGAIDAGLNSYGAKHFTPRALNWMHAFFGLGTTTGPMIVTAVLGSGMIWRVSYVIVGLAQLALAITFFVTRRYWQQEPSAEDSSQTTSHAPTLETLRRPVVWFGMLMFFFYCGVELATAQWSYSVLTLGRGVPATTAGFIVSLYWGSLMVGRILFGFIANRVPLIATLRLCIIGSIIGALLFWLDLSLAFSVIGLMMIGFFFAPIFASLISLTPKRVGEDHANSAIGFQVAAAALGAASLTGLAGILARILGLEIIGLAIFVAAILLLVFYEAFMHSGKRR
ncbi:MFS transporter [Saccharophagus sp. K07]|uniref:MFS transporter n=1 Tax=Saccharophagus sp. K07 TaxID=2283636 RepID=UPI00165226E5|nr:MFS transporter [Saccharophagus sp. K07]MBC6907219.1 MFS transporter [Saccharophagus sp. K07]